MSESRQFDEASAPNALRRQLWRFGLVGIANVGVDLGLYTGLMLLSAGLVASKAIAFAGGTLFAFVCNRSWTFEADASNWWTFLPFALLYSASMILNVGINTSIVVLTGGSAVGLVVAYGLAVGASAAANFVGMRLLFNTRRPRGT